MKRTIQTYFCLLLLLTIFIDTTVEAQKLTTKSKKAAALYKKGSDYYANNKFEFAKMPLEDAIIKDPSFIEAYILLSEVYYEQENYQKQAEYLEEAVGIDSTFYVLSYYNLGVANFYQDKFDDAAKWFTKYYDVTKSSKGKARVEAWRKKLEFAKKTKSNPMHIEAVNLGPAINSKYNEYWPSVTADDKIMVYTVLVPRDTAMMVSQFTPAMANYFHEDFFRSIKDNSGDWGKRAALPSPINSNMNEGAQSLSADGNWMFFTACGRSDSRGSCDIYFSYRTEYGWSAPKNIGPPVNTPYWESQPSFSADGRTLYFASSREGGKGGNDIWKADLLGLKTDGTPFFGNPVNLGDSINTYANEAAPFIHQDNKTLYFSSTGWPGLGEMDIFMSRLDENGQFQKAQNLGYPINSSGDDIGLVVTANGQKAYFASERLGESYGGKDIYSFAMPKELQPTPVSYVKGRVFDMETKEKLKASFELKDLETKKMVVQASSTDFSGEFLICLPIGSSYALNVSKKGYLFYSDHFDMENKTTVDDPKVLDIYLKPIKVGEQIVLKNIFFETNSFALKSISTVELDKLVSFLQLNETLKVKFVGHTDNVGTAEYNKDLSEKRAHEVYNYIVEAGIPKERLSFEGKGMSVPVADNNTEEGRAQNRRTELEIVGK